MQLITLFPLYHRGEERIAIRFSPSPVLEGIIKKAPMVRWSRTHNCWYIPCRKDSYKALLDNIGREGCIDNNLLKSYLEQRKALVCSSEVSLSKATATLMIHHPLNKTNLEAFSNYKHLLILKGYSPATQKTYCNAFLFLLGY